MVQVHLDQKINMWKKVKNNINPFYYYLTGGLFTHYRKLLKNRPQKVTDKFLVKLILQNAKINKQSRKFMFGNKAEHTNDMRDDEDFFILATAIFLFIFFLWCFFLLIYFIF